MNEPKIKRYEKRKSSGRGKAMHKTLVISFLVVLCLVVLAFTPWFRIKNIIIEGNEHIDDEYICRISGVSVGMNTFSIKLSEVIDNLEAEPYIHEARIKREFPNDVRIVVTESEPMAIIPFAEGKFALIDCYGKVLEVITIENGEYPEITGVSVTVTQGHDIEPLDAKDESRVDAIRKILAELPACSVRDRISEINLADINNIIVVLNSGKMEARLCDIDNIDYKLKMLASIVELLESEGKTEGIIDFAGENPVHRPFDIIAD